MLIQQISPTRQEIDIQNLSCLIYKNYPILPFDKKVIDFSSRLSKRILNNIQYGRVPALVALAYWLRPSNLSKIVNQNILTTKNSNIQITPIGLVFHVCPANVDTMFIYSLIISILMGNKNILRISNRLDHEYIIFLFHVLNEELKTKESSIFNNYINIVTYQHDTEINQFFAEKANARLIWGGDETIRKFKSIIGNPRSKDIVFADRISIAIFATINFLNEDLIQQKKIIKNFYNDTYTFDQKGCSSAQSIFLYGNLESNKKFIQIFTTLLEEVISAEYNGDSASLSSLKYNQLISDVLDGKVQSSEYAKDSLHLVKSTSKNLYHSCGGGYFYLYEINKITQIIDYINNKVQTISYYGLSPKETKLLSIETSGLGVDRIVQIGNALNFDYIWDGYNLCEELSNKKYIQ
jgi:hypothetical protein